MIREKTRQMPEVDFRRALTADTTFYIRTDGSDSNNGRTNTAAGAMLTLQGMVDYLKRSIDFFGYQVTINIADGTYIGALHIDGPFTGQNATNILRFLGNTSNPENVIVTTTNGNHAARIMFCPVKFSGISFSTTGPGGCAINAGIHAYIEHDNCRLGPATEDVILTHGAAQVISTGPTTFVGNASSCIHATLKSVVVLSQGYTVTWEGSPVYSTYLYGINDATVAMGGATLVGAKTGTTLVHWGANLKINGVVGNPFGGPIDVTGESGIHYIPVQDTIYVRATATNNDTDGYENTDDRAFLTIGAAISYLKKRPYDPANSKNPKIKVGPGTWTPQITPQDIPFVDSVILEGDTTTPGNVVISTTSSCVNGGNRITPWYIQGFKMTTSSGDCLSGAYSKLFWNAIEFGSCTGYHVNCTRGARMEANGNYAISAGAAGHVNCEDQGLVFIAGLTVTITNTPNFSSRFATVTMGGYARLSPTWSGSATGTRYTVTMNGVLNVAGGGTSALPGDAAAGTPTATGGQYA